MEKSCSGRDDELRLFRFTSGLVAAELISSGRVHGSSIQLVFAALPSPPLSPGGGRADMLWSASSGSCYAWQEVQPREAQGPRFWQGEQERGGGKRGEKEGVMQRAAPLMPGDSLPGTVCPAGGGSGAQEGIWSILGDVGKGMGLREALHGPEQSPAHLSLARAQLPARAPPELSVPTSLPWAVLGNGQSTAPAFTP